MGILLQPYDFNVLARRIDMRLMLLRAGVDHLRQQGIKQGARWRYSTSRSGASLKPARLTPITATCMAIPVCISRRIHRSRKRGRSLPLR